MWITPACFTAAAMARAFWTVRARGFLADDVLACLGRRNGNLGVDVVGCADVDHVDIGPGHHGAPVR